MDRILTKSDREYLRGDKQYKGQKSESNKLRDIRERVYQSLLDFELLVDELPEEERQKIFERLSEESDSHGAYEAASIIEFLYKGFSDLTADPSHIAASPDELPVDQLLAFRNALSKGIEAGKSDCPMPQEEPPNIVTIASNAYLFEFPDKDELRSELDTDQWREINKLIHGDPSDYGSTAINLQTMMQRQVHQNILTRHRAANKNIKDYTEFELDPADND